MTSIHGIYVNISINDIFLGSAPMYLYIKSLLEKQ